MQRFVLRWTGLPGGEAVNVLHSTGTVEADAQSFANDITNAIQGIIGGITSRATFQVDPLVTTVNPATGEATAFHTVDTPALPGASLGDPLPSSIAMLVQFATGDVLRGRRVQGRLFLPAQTEETSTAGRPNLGARTDVAATFATLINPTAAATLCVWSRPQPGQSNGELSVVTAVTCWQEWAQIGKRRS